MGDAAVRDDLAGDGVEEDGTVALAAVVVAVLLANVTEVSSISASSSPRSDDALLAPSIALATVRKNDDDRRDGLIDVSLLGEAFVPTTAEGGCTIDTVSGECRAMEDVISTDGIENNDGETISVAWRSASKDERRPGTKLGLHAALLALPASNAGLVLVPSI